MGSNRYQPERADEQTVTGESFTVTGVICGLVSSWAFGLLWDWAAVRTSSTRHPDVSGQRHPLVCPSHRNRSFSAVQVHTKQAGYITCLVTQGTVSCGLSGDCSRGHRPHSGDTSAVKTKGVTQLLLVSVFLMGVDTIKWLVYTNYPENDGSSSNGKEMTLSHT